MCSVCSRQWVAILSICSYHFFFPEELLLCQISAAMVLLNVVWRIKKDSVCNQHMVSRDISLTCAILTEKSKAGDEKAKFVWNSHQWAQGQIVGEVAKGAKSELCGPCPKAIQVTQRCTATVCRLVHADGNLETLWASFWRDEITNGRASPPYCWLAAVKDVERCVVVVLGQSFWLEVLVGFFMNIRLRIRQRIRGADWCWCFSDLRRIQITFNCWLFFFHYSNRIC